MAQGYLKETSSVDESSGKHVAKFSLGVRTFAEFGKHNICKWIAQVHGETLSDEEYAQLRRANDRMLAENYDEFDDANLVNNE